MNCTFFSSKLTRNTPRLLRALTYPCVPVRAFAMSSSAPAALPAQSQQNGPAYKPRYIDIGINLTDPVYSGLYHGTQRHPSDLHAVVDRAKDAGCGILIVTGSDLEESRKATKLAEEFPGTIFSTIGVHPCSSQQFSAHKPNPQDMLNQLRTLALEAKNSKHCVAFGEIGLDYDRLMLCPKDIQLEYFEKQLDIAVEVGLPLFLHSRAAHEDFVRILSEREDKLPKRGVVHSFTGTISEMQDLVSRGWFIGVNGCSLKTEDNLDVVKAIPLDKLMLETDGPWCEIRASHAGSKFLEGYVEGAWKWVKKEKWIEGALIKGRNESCMVGKVAWIVAGVRGIGLEEVCEAAWRNTCSVFELGGES
ncbi:hypothetical protein BGZ60DRAFT_395161 [Tricladium varicosporioides]|nr:hypothetical protein BGZ60DRAFT_395161 [Hymenoscyphus varicosporioides]